MNRAGPGSIAVGLAAVALAAGCARTTKLSAAEIVAKSVAARGGLDAWRKVETMVWMGHVESAHAPAPDMPFSLEQKRPNKTRLQIGALGYRSVRVFDGVSGWKVPPARGEPHVQPYTPQELKSAQAGHGIDGPLIDHAARGNSVTLEGVEEIGDRKAYHLKVNLKSGADEHVWVDAETWLEVRYDRTAEGPAGSSRRVSVTYGDYRHMDGLQIPFLIQTGGGPGTSPDRMQIERVVLNPPLHDSVFANPADPRFRRRGFPELAPREFGRHRAFAPVAPSSAGTAPGGERGTAPR